MLELLFLLLPLAAAYGYYMGRSSLRAKRLSSKNRHNSTYLRGVEYLLSNNHDKAVENFIAYLNASDPTFETRLALGNLLRQRGEFDRAIALHEKMAGENDADEIEKELSLLELARDFLSAGVFNRAEDLLKQLVTIPRQRKQSAKLLLKVYEREGDYKQAIAIASEHKEEIGKEIKSRLAQYWCEIGIRSTTQDQGSEAEECFKKALVCDQNCERARIELAEIMLQKSRNTEALKFIKEAYAQDSSCSLLCLDLLRRCFVNKADPNYRFALEDLVHRTSSAEAMAELVRCVEQSSGVADAEAMLMTFLHDKPNLKLFSALMELRSHRLDAEENDALMQLKSLIDAQIVQRPKYSCRKCGFESSVMFWQCPSCRSWETLKPKNGIDGD